MVLDLFRLDGRAALVTGGARGLGREIAVALAEAGADVALLDRLPVQGTADRIEQTGRRAHLIEFDLSDCTPESADKIIADSVRALGRLDILVNNAGIIRRAPALEYPTEDWHAVLQVNLSGAFLLAQAAARHFLAAGGGGKIINIASMLSFQGGVQVPAYTAAKSGLAGLTRALANEWASHGINVNAIAPGYFATEVTSEIREDGLRSDAILSRIPASRWGEASDIKGAVVFLVSDASAYVHGTILPVDGGWLAW